VEGFKVKALQSSHGTVGKKKKAQELSSIGLLEALYFKG
jgi:hypothetical protein